jgi:hypothetical protein
MLYRYLSTSTTYPAVEKLRAIVDSNVLWAAAAFSFNDPFEFKVKLDMSAPSDVRLARYRRDNPLATEADARLWERTLDGASWHTAMNLRASLLNTYGVICFTRSWNDLSLWSHYAKAHTGFCVGFDENEVVAWGAASVQGDVNYVSEVPVFRYFYEPPVEFVRKAMFYKAENWHVEREFRLAFESSGIKQFPSSALREVVLGCRAEPALRHYAASVAAAENIDAFQAAEDLTGFGLTRQLIDGNVKVMTSFF